MDTFFFFFFISHIVSYREQSSLNIWLGALNQEEIITSE